VQNNQPEIVEVSQAVVKEKKQGEQPTNPDGANQKEEGKETEENSAAKPAAAVPVTPEKPNPKKRATADGNKDASKRKKKGDVRDKHLMGFGKHANLTYEEVKQRHPGYCTWAKKQQAPTGRLRNFMEYLGVKVPVVDQDGKKRLSFGKHRGLTYQQVLSRYPGYCSWAINQSSPFGPLAHFAHWILEHESEQELEDRSWYEPHGCCFCPFC
jgi:pyruvate/2-oxoglutarate dehydrogenase complex dihydrolipoamide acyltransferase (E2) component